MFTTARRSKKLLAHRISYEMHCGPIPEGFYVCHKCDKPECTNPDHLFVGSAKDNSDDMIKKGRKRTVPSIGENHGMALLSEEQAIAALTDPRIATERAGELGCSKSTIAALKNGQNWKHLPRKKTGIRVNHFAKLTPEQVSQIKQSTERQCDLAEQYSVCRQTIARIHSGQYCGHIP